MRTHLTFILTLFCLTYSVGQNLHTLHKDLPCVNKTFNIHAHVILDSLMVANYTATDLANAIEGANKYFEPICIDFRLCGVDTIYNWEFDSLATAFEDDELARMFFETNRINVYLASELKAPTICGFASLSGIASPNNGKIWLKCQGPGTLTHELGHLFGLLHTFEGSGVELVDGSNCETAGDGICDTPADPYIQDSEINWQEGCEFIYTGLDANGEFYQPDMGNIMSYYGCDCGFTYGQYLKMAKTYLNANHKMW